MKYDAVFFDLDGTIIDSAPGIIESVQYSAKKMGLPEKSFDELLCFIGPPLLDQFISYFDLSKEDGEEAVRLYRENYSAGAMYHVTVYEGIRELLIALKSAGILTVVTTSKPERFARQIMAHYDLDGYFDFICGIHDDNVSADKREVLFKALEVTGAKEKGLNTVLIGDRKYDAMGAAITGIDFIGVNYGFAPEGEFEEFGVSTTADTAQDLKRLLL